MLPLGRGWGGGCSVPSRWGGCEMAPALPPCLSLSCFCLTPSSPCASLSLSSSLLSSRAPPRQALGVTRSYSWQPVGNGPGAGLELPAAPRQGRAEVTFPSGHVGLRAGPCSNGLGPSLPSPYWGTKEGISRSRCGHPGAAQRAWCCPCRGCGRCLRKGACSSGA